MRPEIGNQNHSPGELRRVLAGCGKEQQYARALAPAYSFFYLRFPFGLFPQPAGAGTPGSILQPSLHKQPIRFLLESFKIPRATRREKHRKDLSAGTTRSRRLRNFRQFFGFFPDIAPCRRKFAMIPRIAAECAFSAVAKRRCRRQMNEERKQFS
jgi:hypothetical protein